LLFTLFYCIFEKMERETWYTKDIKQALTMVNLKRY